MGHWLLNIVSNVSYDVIAGLFLALAGWLVRRAIAHRDEAPREEPVTQKQDLLPRAPRHFINRETSLATLDALAAETQIAAAPVIAVVSGLHGVGKTAFSSIWAYKNRTSFPDGVLWADFSRRKGLESHVVSDILGEFLHELGVSDLAMPISFRKRQKAFERLTADRRLLVLLDDVSHGSQAEPLYPAGGGSLVVVTSNSKLEDLVRDGACPVTLGPLGDDESVELLGRFVSPERLAPDAEAVRQIVRACAGLPIALCVCGGKLAVNQHLSPARLAEQLTGADRLDLLSPEGAFDLRGVLDMAYDDLDEVVATMYRRVGLIPGRDFTVEAAAAACGVSLSAALAATASLDDQFLISAYTDDRLRAHDLVRDHMRRRAEIDEPDEERFAVAKRVVDWYTAAVQAADHAVVSNRLRLNPDAAVGATFLPELASSAEAFGWFVSERHNLLATQQAALRAGWFERVWQIAEAFWPLCASHKRFDEWVVSHIAAIEAGTELGDERVLARMHSQLARAYAEMGQHEKAREEMEAALVAVLRSGDQALTASVVEFGGVCQLRAGDLAAALESFTEACELFGVCGLDRGVALQHYHLGWCLVLAGEFDAAIPMLDEALGEMTELGDVISASRVLLRKGEAWSGIGQLGKAADALEGSLALATQAGVDFEQAEAHEALAEVASRSADATGMQAHRQAAYRIYQSLGHQRAELLLAQLAPGATTQDS